MKRIFFCGLGGMICMMTILCSFSKPSYASRIRLENIEALADDEFIIGIDENGWRYCRCHRKMDVLVEM